MFIRKCLVIDEKKRITWDDIYKHPLVVEVFAASVDFSKSLEDPAIYLLNEIRMKLIEKHLKLSELVN